MTAVNWIWWLGFIVELIGLGLWCQRTSEFRSGVVGLGLGICVATSILIAAEKAMR